LRPIPSGEGLGSAADGRASFFVPAGQERPRRGRGRQAPPGAAGSRATGML